MSELLVASRFLGGARVLGSRWGLRISSPKAAIVAVCGGETGISEWDEIEEEREDAMAR